MFARVSFAFALGLLAALFVGFGAATQTAPPLEQKKQKKAEPVKQDEVQPIRMVYFTRTVPAAYLADLLSKHFKDDAAFVVAPAEGGPPFILITAKTARVYKDIIMTLPKLDPPLGGAAQPPMGVGSPPQAGQVVAIEVFLLDLPAKAKAEVPGKVLDQKQLSGPSEQVSEYIHTLQKNGAVSGQRRFRLVTLADQATEIHTGMSKAYVSGVVTSGGPKGPPILVRNIAYRDVGTTVQVNPSVGAEQLITLHLHIDDTQAVQAENGIPIGHDEKGAPIVATEFVTTGCSPRLTLKSGQAVLVNELDFSTKSGESRTLVVASARLK